MPAQLLLQFVLSLGFVVLTRQTPRSSGPLLSGRDKYSCLWVMPSTRTRPSFSPVCARVRALWRRVYVYRREMRMKERERERQGERWKGATPLMARPVENDDDAGRSSRRALGPSEGTNTYPISRTNMRRRVQRLAYREQERDCTYTAYARDNAFSAREGARERCTNGRRIFN